MSKITETGIGVDYYVEDGVLKSRVVFRATAFRIDPAGPIFKIEEGVASLFEAQRPGGIDLNLRAELQALIDAQNVRIAALEAASVSCADRQTEIEGRISEIEAESIIEQGSHHGNYGSPALPDVGYINKSIERMIEKAITQVVHDYEKRQRR